MNVIGTIMNLWNLNRGLPASGKVVIKEGIDVISALGRSLKDNKITAKEKAVIVNEIRQFSNAAIKTLESITIPEEKPNGKKNFHIQKNTTQQSRRLRATTYHFFLGLEINIDAKNASFK